MKEKITHNLGLKLLALLFSVVLWFVIVNISDPVDYVTFTDIPVTIRNADSVTDEGKVFTVQDGTDTVNVRVYAQRSVLESFSASDITVIADMEDLTFMNTVTYKVSFGRHADEVERYVLSADNMKVAIEDVKGIQVEVTPVVTGEPAEGYVIGNISVGQNMIRLTGGESVIDRIASAQVVVDVEGWNSDIATQVPLKLYDAAGNEISTSSLTSSVNDIKVNITIYPTKTVPVTIEVTGTPAEGYAATGSVTITPSEVTLAGPASVLASVTSVDIPEGVMNITGQSSSMRITTDLNKYLADGVRIVTDDDSSEYRVTVLAVIEKLLTRTYLVPAANVSFENIPEGYQVSIMDDSLEAGFIHVSLTGISDALNEVEEAVNWRPVIDLEGYLNADVLESSGMQDLEIPLPMELPEGVTAEEVLLSVSVTRIPIVDEADTTAE